MKIPRGGVCALFMREKNLNASLSIFMLSKFAGAFFCAVFDNLGKM